MGDSKLTGVTALDLAAAILLKEIEHETDEVSGPTRYLPVEGHVVHFHEEPERCHVYSNFVPPATVRSNSGDRLTKLDVLLGDVSPDHGTKCVFNEDIEHRACAAPKRPK